ncbi:doublesex [Mycetomoellerius zeteki]|uniref:doublesex n=1 Tax=Mycetomoellerius zeteki TaxID=64791 RepID=UPI00084E5EB0|nr:PREDICTED: uncharacterized protein LOC108731461 [Trachymyrmex zeteki]
MDKVKKKVSSLAGTEIPKTKTGRRKPICGRCNIHNVEVTLEGHKKYCLYKDCYCQRCYIFLEEQRIAADKIAWTRMYKLSKKKKISQVERAMSPISLLYPTRKNDGLSSLLIYTLQEMYKSFTVWRNPTKIERIFRILANYACEIDSRIKFNGFLESTKHWILQVISEEDPMSFMTFQQATTCCYIPPTQILQTPYKEQLNGIKSDYPLLNLEYPSQNFPVWSSNFSSMTTTNMSLETLKSPSELSVKPFDSSIDSPTGSSTDSPIEPFPDSPTDLSIKCSTYY